MWGRVGMDAGGCGCGCRREGAGGGVPGGEEKWRWEWGVGLTGAQLGEALSDKGVLKKQVLRLLDVGVGVLQGVVAELQALDPHKVGASIECSKGVRPCAGGELKFEARIVGDVDRLHVAYADTAGLSISGLVPECVLEKLHLTFLPETC